MSQSALAEWKAGGRRVKYRGSEVFVAEGGDGEALLCLHGYPYSSWHWRSLWPALTQQFRVIAPDMIGCGLSDKPRDINYNILAQADLMESVLQHFGITEVRLLAHDYGVSIAQEFLARNQEGRNTPRVSSVCFLNGGLLPEKFRERMEHRMIRIQGMQAALLFDGEAFERSVGALYGTATRPVNGALAGDWELANCNGGLFVADKIFHFLEERQQRRERWVGAMQRARVPLRLVNGAADPIAGQAMADSFKAAVPHAEVISLPDIGHFPHLEAPEQVLQALQGFAAAA